MFDKLKYKRVNQISEKGCGVASLATILKNYGSDISISKLNELAKLSEDGTSLLGLSKAAKYFNFDTKAIKADRSIFEIENLTYPFIAHVVKKNGLLHYYVIFKAEKDKIIVFDPDPNVDLIKMDKEDFFSEWTGYCLFFSPRIDYIPIKQSNKYSILQESLMNNKRLIFNIVLASIVIIIISIVSSLYMRLLIDKLIPSASINSLTIISFGLILVQILQKVLEYGRNFLIVSLNQKISIDILIKYLKKLYELPINFFNSRSVGDIVSRFNDASTLTNSVSEIIITSFLDTLMLVILLIVLFYMEQKLFSIVLITIPIFIIIVIAYLKKYDRYNKEILEANAKVSNSIIEDVYGMETIKTLNQEKNSMFKVDIEFTNLLKKDFKFSQLINMQNALKTGTKTILSTLILWYGSRLVISNTITLGKLLTFNSLLMYFFNPLENIIGLQSKIQQSKVALERLLEIYESKSEKYIDDHGIELKGPIIIKDLSFSYGYSKKVLSKLNLTINRGEKIAIIGDSGSGKSTLAKLISGLYKPTSGDIIFDEKNIKNYNLKNLRNQIVYLPQNPYIFSGSILDNLTIGMDDDISMDDIDLVLKDACIFNEVVNMPFGINTRISHDGNTLSGGQKQRISLARALMKKKNILILDEATSSLDSRTENTIITNLLKNKDVTIIFITHKKELAKRLDKIYTIRNGNIVIDNNARQVGTPYE